MTVNHAKEGRIRRGLHFDISFARFGQEMKKLRSRNRGWFNCCENEKEV